MIPVAQGVVPGRREGRDPPQPIRAVDHQHDEGRHQAQTQHHQVPEPHPGHEKHGGGKKTENRRRPEIRLGQQQGQQHPQHHEVRKHAHGKILDALLLGRQGVGQVNHQGQLGWFGGLKGQPAKAQPTAGAARAVPHPGHQDQDQGRRWRARGTDRPTGTASGTGYSSTPAWPPIRPG